LYRFQEEDTQRFALTREPGGVRLPVLGCVWRFAGPTRFDDPDLAEAGLERGRVTEEILKKGYFLWPDDLGVA
jgi:hypothetical protein